VKVIFGFVAISMFALSTLAYAEPLSEERVKELILETIRENPRIVREAIELLQRQESEEQAKQAKAVLSNNREIIEKDPNAPVLGNPEGNVTVVEFFDYNCPYCKKAADDIKTLIQDDNDIRLVYREFPILGDGSVFAARAALAARKQGKYEEMHWALMLLQRAEEASILKAAGELGLDLEKLKADMKAPEVDEHIQKSLQLAQVLGINGTPSFIVGDALAPGAIPLEELRKLVDESRTNKK
jgi:protein-disulfide isomerase